MSALIVGAGPGLSASLARKLSARGVKVALAARSVDKLAPLVAETGAKAYQVAAHSRITLQLSRAECLTDFSPLVLQCDASDPASVDALFTAVDKVGLVSTRSRDAAAIPRDCTPVAPLHRLPWTRE